MSEIALTPEQARSLSVDKFFTVERLLEHASSKSVATRARNLMLNECRRGDEPLCTVGELIDCYYPKKLNRIPKSGMKIIAVLVATLATVDLQFLADPA